MGPVIIVALSIPFVAVLVGSPLLRRLATRNAARRPIEAVLVIGGSLLGTAIITGSLIVGDTIDRSIRAAAYDQLGPVDEIVSVPLAAGRRAAGPLHGLRVADRRRRCSRLTTTDAAVVHPGAWRRNTAARAAPRGRLPRRRAASAVIPAATGISGATPVPGTAVISADLAHKLGVGRGDRITVFAAGGTRDVRRVAASCDATWGRGLLDRSTRASSRTTCSSLPARPRSSPPRAATVSSAHRRRRCSRSPTPATSRTARRTRVGRERRDRSAALGARRAGAPREAGPARPRRRGGHIAHAALLHHRDVRGRRRASCCSSTCS